MLRYTQTIMIEVDLERVAISDRQVGGAGATREAPLPPVVRQP